MGHRTGFAVSKKESAPSRPSPNAVVSQITVEIRVYWPPAMGNEEQVLDLLADACREAEQLVQQQAVKVPPAKIHRHDGRFCLDCEADISWCTNPSEVAQ